MKNGYKVLGVGDTEDFGHSCTFRLSLPGRLIYKNKKLTVSCLSCGPMAVFDSYSHAKAFCNANEKSAKSITGDGFVIVDCLYQPADMDLYDYKWREWALWTENSCVDYKQIPAETILASKVICYW